MKHIFLIALSLIAHQSIAMDKQSSFAKATADKPVATQTNSNAALDEIVTLIDKKINEKYLRSSLFDGLSITYNTKDNYFNIISMSKTIYPNITFNENLLDKLYAKNNIFAKAINYFVFHAQKNFENVTPANLNTVNDFNAPQSIPLFNGFDQSIRKYILQRATNKIEHECTMKIVTGATIIDFDICPKTDTAAISTGDRHTRSRLCLWDLKKVALLHTFEEENPVHFVCFNTPGNQLATLIVMAGKSKIKIWNPQSKQLLHIIEPTPGYNPDALVYNNHPTNYLLHATSNASYPETWITSTEQCLPYGFSEARMYATNKQLFRRGNYCAVCPQKIDILEAGMIAAGLKSVTLDVTKSNCSNLYLCEQAIKKAQNKQSLNLITESNPFKTATEYEQALIRESLGRKKNQLTS